MCIKQSQNTWWTTRWFIKFLFPFTFSSSSFFRNFELYSFVFSPPAFRSHFLETAGLLYLYPSSRSIAFPTSPDIMFHARMFLATFILALFAVVSAALYPTKPIQNTVYYAGETALTTWIDDGSFPPLSNMGSITIQLYTNSDVRIRCFFPFFLFRLLIRRGTGYLAFIVSYLILSCADIPRDAGYERGPSRRIPLSWYTPHACVWWLEFVSPDALPSVCWL